MPGTTYDPKTKTWRGPVVPPLYNIDQNIGNLLLTTLHYHPNEIAQISADSGVALSCRQIRERAIVMAEYYKKCNIKEDDFVAFVNYNTENLVPAIFGCFALGIPTCPLSPILVASDISRIFVDIKPPLVFCDERNLATVQEAINAININTKILTIREKVPGYECASDIIKNADYSIVDEFEAPIVNADKILGIICSSGTTGAPKKIIKTHREMLSNFHTGRKLKRISPAVSFNYSCLFWISGFNSAIFNVLNHTTTVITDDVHVAPENLVDILRRYKVTHVVTLPFTIVNILQVKNLQPFDYIESWMVSGFAMTKSLCDKFAPYLPNGGIQISYGLTETFIISCNFYGTSDNIGVLNDNMVVRLIDSDGNNVGPNTHGELLVKKPVPFGGYHMDPKKTMESLKDGWFYTCDICYFDDNNLLHFVDRKVTIMSYDGYYISPHELESLINQIDGVHESSIVGVMEKDTVNYILHAFVIADKSRNLRENDVLEYVHSKVIDERKIRGGVHFVDSFPFGRTGKVDRVKLQEMAVKLVKNEIEIRE